MERTKDLIGFWEFYVAATASEAERSALFNEKMCELEAAFPSINRDRAFYAYQVAIEDQTAKIEDELREQMSRLYLHLLVVEPETDDELAEWRANYIRAFEEPLRLFNTFLATLKK